MNIEIRGIREEEFDQLGSIMVNTYANLEGFPSQTDQPKYYEMLRNIGLFTKKNHTRVLVAVSNKEEVLGGVVYFSDMRQYGSGGKAVNEKDASGIRLLAVKPNVRGGGVGKALTIACIDLAKASGNKQIILHTTKAMNVAWGMYERLGFKRSSDLDFMQENLFVYGFRNKSL